MTPSQQIQELNDKVTQIEAVVSGLMMNAEIDPQLQRTIALAVGKALSKASVGDFGDVVLSSLSNGQVLKYNGTNWYNGTDIDT